MAKKSKESFEEEPLEEKSDPKKKNLKPEEEKSGIKEAIDFLSGKEGDEPQEKKKVGFFSFLRKSWKLEPESSLINKFGHIYKEYQGQKEKEIEKLQTYESIGLAARLSREFLVLLAGSCLIATFGLFAGSTAVIIGAMLIAPLMMPILGLALASIWGDKTLLWRSAFTLLIGSIMVLIVSSSFTLILPTIEINSEIQARINPNLYDIMIALASGLIGAYAYVNPNISGSVSGVAIAVALMPPLCTTGIFIGLLEKKILFPDIEFSWGQIGSGLLGSLLLYITNLVGISLAASIVFWRLRIHPTQDSEGEVDQRATRNVFVSSVLLLIIAIPLGYFMWQTYDLSKKQVAVKKTLNTLKDSQVVSLKVDRRGDQYKVEAVIAQPPQKSFGEHDRIKAELQKILKNKARIQLVFLPMTLQERPAAPAAEKPAAVDTSKPTPSP